MQHKFAKNYSSPKERTQKKSGERVKCGTKPLGSEAIKKCEPNKGNSAMSELVRRAVSAEVIIKNICAMTQGKQKVKKQIERKRESLKNGGAPELGWVKLKLT